MISGLVHFPRDTSTDTGRRWLNELCGQLIPWTGLPASLAWVGDAAESNDFGWSSWIASLPGGLDLEIWLDQYLDQDQPPQVGMWIAGDPKQVSSRAAAAGVSETLIFSRREGPLPRSSSLKVQQYPGEFMVDRWPEVAFFGLYLKPNPGDLATDWAEPVRHAVERMLASFLLRHELGSALQSMREVELIQRLARPGQRAFRLALLTNDPRCVVTGCDVPAALEAAHIVAVSEGGQDEANGLLLRADIHRLYDRGLLTIDQDGIVWVHPDCRSNHFAELHGSAAALTLTPAQRSALLMVETNALRGRVAR